MTAQTSRLLIVESRYYSSVSDVLLDGAINAVRAAGADWDVVSLPGILELAPAIAMIENQHPKTQTFDGYVALGCVLNDTVVGSGRLVDIAARGLMDLSVSRGVAVGQGLICVDNESDALRWAREADGGGNAARACLELVALKTRRLGQA